MLDRERLISRVNALANDEQGRYFYSRLTTPAAFSILRELGVFDHPYQTIRADQNVLLPIWPPALYLVNVAAAIPDDVASIISRIDTDNPNVIVDLLKALESIPTTTVVSLVKTLKRWIDRSVSSWVIEDFIALIKRLLENNHREAAKTLVDSMIQVRKSDRRQAEDDRLVKALRLEAIAAVGDTYYDHLLTRLWSFYKISAHGTDFLQLLVYKLRQSLSYEEINFLNSDYSSIWLADLTKNPIGFGTKETLAHRLFTSLKEALELRSIDLQHARDLLRKEQAPVFRRIWLALLTEFGDRRSISEALEASELYTDYESRFERADMLRRWFTELGTETQDLVLSNIRSAIDREALRRWYSERLSGDDLENAVEEAAEREYFDEVRIFADHLGPSAKMHFEDLTRRFGEERPSERPGEVWVGPTSPVTPDALAKFTTDQILDYLETWRPSGDFIAPSPSGLGRALTSIVEARPREFLSDRKRIMRLAPVYAYHIIDALRKKVTDSALDHMAFVDLLTYATVNDSAARRGAFQIFDRADEERWWPSLRQMTAFALTDLINSDAVDFSQRVSIWNILSELSTDPDPSPKDDQESEERDAAHVALNSARGAAMLAVFAYLRWVYRHYKAHDSQPDMVALAPEVFELLALRLDASVDPSPAIRSTYGQNFVSLFAISERWATAHASEIFSDDALGAAAWSSYLRFNHVYSKIFRILLNRYEHAVEALCHAQDDEESGDAYDSVDAHLSGHLMLLYGRGELPIDGRTLSTFIDCASPALIGRAINYIGRSLQTDEDVPTAIIERFMRFYEHLLALVEANPHDRRIAALPHFGWWFISGRFPDPWSLDALKRTLTLTRGAIEIDFRVLECLAAMSSKDALGAVQAVSDMTTLSRPFTFMSSRTEQLRPVLENAAAAGGQAYAAAIKVNNWLMAYGMNDFRDLFRSP